MLRKLLQKQSLSFLKEREEINMQQQDYIIGRNAVLEALKSEREINKLWIAEGSQGGSMGEIVKFAKRNGVLVQYVPKKKIEQMVQGTHQGVLALVAAYSYAEIDELFEKAAQKK